MSMSVGLFICSFFLPRFRGETPDKEAFDKHIAKMSLKLDVYDQILSKQKYLAGDVRHLSLALTL
jgi:glutathione S-transferase